MRHRLRSVTPDIDRESLTLYGGLFLLTQLMVGLNFGMGLNPFTGGPYSHDLLLSAVAGVTFGFWPALAVVVFVRLHRYAYPPDA
ncbi:hypothetical protein [Natrinema sp. DC36]|uniref:hypothetical protein n=1 Tax=Natrinema sp. DC36 TaxID=2878680 RepID=UPI001CF08EC8|nr:hypothetical protein [Natrinema sp. DC36]